MSSPFNPEIKSHQIEERDAELLLKIALQFEGSEDILKSRLKDFGQSLSFLLSVLDPKIKFTRELIFFGENA